MTEKQEVPPRSRSSGPTRPTPSKAGRGGGSTPGGASDILARIVESKAGELPALLEREAEFRREAGTVAPPRDFKGALRGGTHVSLIAEVKRRSPGAGAIRPDLDPVALASAYTAEAPPHGAAALSVLTDRRYFGGSLEDLRRVRASVHVPVLRKDFILDPVQVLEARVAGADAVLLIARILDDEALRDLRRAAEALGMAALVEVHTARELERVLEVGSDVIGVNNRDLATFTTDLSTTLSLIESVPDNVVLVSESGIRTRADVERLGEAGVDAVLVGESLLRAEDPGRRAARLAGAPRHARGGQPRGAGAPPDG